MATKVEAATMSAESGIPALVTSTANAARRWPGKTWAPGSPPAADDAPPGMLWLAHLATTQGRLLLDRRRRARRGLRRRVAAAGRASPGSTAPSRPGTRWRSPTPTGIVVARGLVNYSSAELPQMLGRSTQELGEDLGSAYERAVVHVDDLVVV